MNESFGAEGNSCTMPDDVERDDAEAAAALVEHPQLQQVARAQASSR